MSNDTKRINFDIENDLYIDFKIKVLREETSIKKVLTKAIEDYIKEWILRLNNQFLRGKRNEWRDKIIK